MEELREAPATGRESSAAADIGPREGADRQPGFSQATWPSAQAIERLGRGRHGAAVGDGWVDSTLDLLDGLSVVEVFAPPPGSASR